MLEAGACHWDAQPQAVSEGLCSLQPPALSRGSQGVEMFPSRKPPPESLPSAAISELTEPLERPLGALMMTTEGPFMQEWSRPEGSLRAKPRSLASRPNHGAAWGQFRGRKLKHEAGSTLASDPGWKTLAPSFFTQPNQPAGWRERGLGNLPPSPTAGHSLGRGSVWTDE